MTLSAAKPLFLCVLLSLVLVVSGHVFAAGEKAKTPTQAAPAATKKPKQAQPPIEDVKPLPEAGAAPATEPAPPSTTPPAQQRERIEADVSARTIAVNAAFKGSEVTVFGTVANSRQPSPESGYYDVIVAVEGVAQETVVRRKSQVAGLWVNTQSASFQRAPSYFAIASTRPLEEIAEPEVFQQHGIGLQNIQFRASEKTVGSMRSSELRDFQAALARLKEKQGLYARDDYGVTFSGSSLFRSTLALPANIPVGQLVTRIYLFREGQLLNRFTTKVGLERTGIERFIYEAARTSSWLYGIVTVLLAIAAGLMAAALFNRSA